MKALTEHWYRPRPWLTALLAPLEGLFALASLTRRVLYRTGWLKTVRLPVPVVVIGNINVGGVGKTPVVEGLLRQLRARGVAVGLVSRGYGGSHATPTRVTTDSDPAVVGDEPLLLAATGAPVVVGRDRVAAARHLLEICPDTALILADDGLQHYRLGRTLEIVVLDVARGAGNGHLLPAGPLREPVSRLRTVDAVVLNEGTGVATCAPLALPQALPQFRMRLMAGALESLAQPGRQAAPADFAGQRVVALAGIGHPERFFDTLRQQGLELSRTLAFPDHHPYSEADIPAEAGAVIVTTKDAVKLQCVNRARLWQLPVRAEFSPDLADWILKRLKRDYGR